MNAPEKGIAVGSARRGRRESNKADKRRRIREAARALFSKYGYDDTTVRMIARRAGVANGTISLYARDKRDLVLLVFNHEISRTLDRATAAAQKKRALLDKLIAYCGAMYEDFHANLAMSRIHLQLNHYATGMHSAEYYGRRRRVSDFLEAALREAQQTGEIAADMDPALVAKLLFFVYSASVRWWAASRSPDLKTGIRELRSLFALQLSGLGPGAVAFSSLPRQRRAVPRASTTAHHDGSLLL